MSETDERCGSTDTTTGGPCQRPAGWGTDSDSGHCKDHVSDTRALRKFTTETRERILAAAETGAYKEHCAQAGEVTEQTLRNWLNWGEDDDADGKDTELAAFYLEWQRARGRGVVSRLENASDEFVLERSHGYTKEQTVEHTGDGLSFKITPEQKEQLDELFTRDVQNSE